MGIWKKLLIFDKELFKKCALSNFDYRVDVARGLAEADGDALALPEGDAGALAVDSVFLGNKTVSIICTTPLDAFISLVITFAPPTVTLLFEIKTASSSP